MSRTGLSALLRPADRLPVLFLIGIVLPGVVLVVFSVRALVQERQIAWQQAGDRLDRTADATVAALEAELDRWQEALDELAASGAFDTARPAGPLAPEGWPTRMRSAIDDPRGAVVLYRADGRTAVIPSTRTLWDPGPTPETPAAALQSDLLGNAQRAETAGDFAGALTLYESLLARAPADERAVVLHRVARTHHKAGQHEDALRRYGELESMGRARVGALPAELVARHAIALLQTELGDPDRATASALELYRALVTGRWRMEKPRYLYYSTQARKWLGLEAAAQTLEAFGGAGEAHDPTASPELDQLYRTEVDKLTFSMLVEDFLKDPRAVLRSGDAFGIALWRQDPFVALVFAPSAVETYIWSPAAARIVDDTATLALLHDGGGLLSGTGEAPDGMVQATRALTDRRYPLAVQAWPSDPAALRNDLAARQSIYIGMLVLVIALLAFGSYLTVRTVRREVEVARLKSRFVSAVSHEFRSPLTGIRQLAEMLVRDRVPNEERKHSYYRMIARESSRLSRLVENVLDFSRIEEDRREYDKQPIDTAAWLADLVDDFRSELNAANLTLAADIAAPLPQLRGDREALSCAVHNLLDNAVKYSAGQDTVWLEAAASNGSLTIRVRDRGIGISRADRRHVFDKFFRAGGDVAAEVKGVGLGLSLAHHIVSAHDGSIEVDSEPGSGSTFTIELPVDTNGG